MSVAAIPRVTGFPRPKAPDWAPVAIVVADILALEFTLTLACAVRMSLGWLAPIHVGVDQYVSLSIGILTVPIANCWFGLYPGYGMGAVERLRARVFATVSVFSVLLAWNHVFEAQQWSRGILAFTGVLALVIPPALQIAVRSALMRAGVFGVRVLVLGAGETGESIIRKFRKHRDLGFVPVAVLDDDSEKWGLTVDGIPVIGPLESAGSYSDSVNTVVIAIRTLSREHLAALVERLSFQTVIVVPNLLNVQSLWIESRDLGGTIGLELRKNLLVRRNRWLKRTLDYAIAVPAAVAFAPLVLLFAIWIRMVSPGPVFYSQEREGAYGRRFRVWKLRTMHCDSEPLLNRYLEKHPEEREFWQAHFKLKNDPRVLRGVGRLLRRTSLDELPQLWNVLQGDMSLVGPRPFPYYHLENFPSRFRKMRVSVMPGLTGLWQVSERSNGDLKVQEAQDTYYIRNWSVWLDIHILLRTIRTVVAGSGAY